MVKSLNKKEQKKVISLFHKETKDARKIAKTLEVPRFAVMRYLEDEGLRYYSSGSYNL